MLTGEPIDAERANVVGFVNRLTDPGATLDGALELAERICANGPAAVWESVAVLDAIVGSDDPLAWALSDSARATIFWSADAAEGRNASQPQCR